MEREPDVYVGMPSVFMVPAKRSNKPLQSYLMGLAPIDPMEGELKSLDVSPFHYQLDNS